MRLPPIFLIYILIVFFRSFSYLQKNATKYLPQKKGNVPKIHEIFKPSEIRDKATPLYLLDTYNTREKVSLV